MKALTVFCLTTLSITEIALAHSFDSFWLWIGLGLYKLFSLTTKFDHIKINEDESK